MVLALDGSTTSVSIPPQRDAVTARFEAALRLWDERTHLWSACVLKRPAGLADDPYPHPGVDAILSAHRRIVGASARRRSRSRSISSSWSTPSEPSRRDGLGAAARPRAAGDDARRPCQRQAPVVDLDADVAQRAAHLRQKVDAFVQQLEGYGRPARAGTRRGVHAVSTPAQLLRPEKGVRLRAPTRARLRRRGLGAGRHRRTCGWMTTTSACSRSKEPPAQTHALLFKRCTRSRRPMVIVSEMAAGRAGGGPPRDSCETAPLPQRQGQHDQLCDGTPRRRTCSSMTARPRWCATSGRA